MSTFQNSGSRVPNLSPLQLLSQIRKNGALLISAEKPKNWDGSSQNCNAAISKNNQKNYLTISQAVITTLPKV